MQDKIARYQEIERRGLLGSLPQEKQNLWAEYKRRQQPPKRTIEDLQILAEGKERVVPEMDIENSPLDYATEFLKGGFWKQRPDGSYYSPAITGAESVLNGFTVGGYSALGDELGLNVSGRRKEVEKDTGLAGKGANLGLEIAGNLIGPGKGLMKLGSSAGLRGGKLLAGAGAVEGAGYGLTGSIFDENKNTPLEMVKGGALGGTIGAAAPMAIKTVGAGIGKVADTGAGALNKLLGKGANKAYDDSFKVLEKELGKDTLNSLLRETTRTGRSILEVGDENVVGFAKNILANSPQARATFTAKAKELGDIRGEQSKKVIDEALGKTTKYEGLEAIKEAYSNKAKPLYKELNKVESMPELESLVKNNATIVDEIKKVKRNFPELAEKKTTSFDVINETRSALQDEVYSGSGNKYYAKKAVRAIDEALEKTQINEIYKEARKLYSDGYKVESALKTGENFLTTGKLPDDLAQDMKLMSKAEKDAMVIGVRNTLNGAIGKFVDDTQALKKLLPQNTRDKLKAIVGKERADSILEFAEAELKSQRNLKGLLNQSQTAEMQAMQRTPILQSAFKAITSPVQTAENLLMKAGGLPTQAKYGRLTDLLIESNPQALQQANLRLQQQPSRAIMQSIDELLNKTTGAAGVVSK